MKWVRDTTGRFPQRPHYEPGEMPEDQPLRLPHACEVRADGPRRWLRFNRTDTTAAELIAAVATRYRIQDLTIEEPEIETIVRRIYAEGLLQSARSGRPERADLYAASVTCATRQP